MTLNVESSLSAGRYASGTSTVPLQIDRHQCVEKQKRVIAKVGRATPIRNAYGQLPVTADQ